MRSARDGCPDPGTGARPAGDAGHRPKSRSPSLPPSRKVKQFSSSRSWHGPCLARVLTALNALNGLCLVPPDARSAAIAGVGSERALGPLPWARACLFCYECGMALTAAGARSVDELLEVIGAGGQPGYLLFWGHQPPVGGGVGRGCLSQWWPAPFTVDGRAYPTAEHYMMVRKALLSGDAATVERIWQAPDPGAAKGAGPAGARVR
jgi:hypothetical protein